MTTEAIAREADKYVRDRAVYVHDRVDLWRSYAKEIVADPDYQIKGDCDDWSQTTLHLLHLRGVPKDKLIRAVVKSKGSSTPDHMIGIVQLDDGTFMSVGDTFGHPGRINLTSEGLIDATTTNGHRIVATSSFADKLLWRGRLVRKANTATRGMRMSDAGVKVLKGHERCVLHTYDDLQPKKALKPGDKVLGTLTNGYGHTGPDVKIGQKITEQEAEANLLKDLAWAEDAVSTLVNVPISQNQYDALVMFVFNAGKEAFRTSTLLKMVNKKASDEQVGVQFRRWINSGGQVMGGLVTRREDEFKLYKGTDKPNPQLSMEVAAAPVVEEHDALIKSKAIWGNVMQFLLGVSIFLPELLEPAQKLQDQVEDVQMKAWIGSFMSLIAVVMFLRRAYEIKVAAAK